MSSGGAPSGVSFKLTAVKPMYRNSGSSEYLLAWSAIRSVAILAKRYWLDTTVWYYKSSYGNTYLPGSICSLLGSQLLCHCNSHSHQVLLIHHRRYDNHGSLEGCSHDIIQGATFNHIIIVDSTNYLCWCNVKLLTCQSYACDIPFYWATQAVE